MAEMTYETIRAEELSIGDVMGLPNPDWAHAAIAPSRVIDKVDAEGHQGWTRFRLTNIVNGEQLNVTLRLECQVQREVGT